MGGRAAAFCAFFAILVIACFMLIGFYLGARSFETSTMSEAYERGHAVQCPGMTGYYWECEE